MKHLDAMRYKDFVFPHNPTALTVSEEKNVRELKLPYAGSTLRDLGWLRRKVNGEAYFTGEDCWQNWQALRALYRRGGAGSLKLPGQEAFEAVFDGLKLLGAAGKDLVKYSFSFTESTAASGPRRVTAQAGETLWDYAVSYERRIEDLVVANPDIRDMLALEEGQEVVVP